MAHKFVKILTNSQLSLHHGAKPKIYTDSHLHIHRPYQYHI